MISLPKVPVIHLPTSGDMALDLLACRTPQALALVGEAGSRYGAVVLRALDAPSRRWAARNRSPYAASLLAVEEALHAASPKTPGAFALNLSYEWACTAGVRVTPQGAEHLRVLDWDTPGLGRHLVVAVRGEVAFLTWAGYVGCVTGMRRNAFTIALNQPPLTLPGARAGVLPQAFAWLGGRAERWRSECMPPAHLVRMVLETATSLDEALALIRDVPVSSPALLSLTGSDGRAVVVEKHAGERAAIILEGESLTCANHWPTDEARVARRANSPLRTDRMAEVLRDVADPDDLSWLRGAILVPCTRVVCVMRPSSSDGHLPLSVAGLEDGGYATAVTHLDPWGVEP